jgi:hypothetical protein
MAPLPFHRKNFQNHGFAWQFEARETLRPNHSVIWMQYGEQPRVHLNSHAGDFRVVARAGIEKEKLK